MSVGLSAALMAVGSVDYWVGGLAGQLPVEQAEGMAVGKAGV